jgi:ABC-2 type transport system ATP-binding protein
MTALEFRDVHRSFSGAPVLGGLTLAVRPGEIFALLGRNGAGKTTAMRILLGFLEPHGGSSSILGRDSLHLTPEDRGRIGLVTEGHKLYGWMRVRDVLAFEAGTRARFDRAYAEHHLKRLAIPADRRVRQLSRGQRATLALLVAVGGRPEVLVMDDPAMGLDPVMRREFLDAMIELLGEEGRAVLFSSHILTDVERIADRVGILHGGALIVDATLDDLKRRVQRRFARLDGPGAASSAFDDLACVLRARPRRDGVELLLLDLDPEAELTLRARSSALSPPAVPTLEELFIDLTQETERSGVEPAT